MGRSEKIILQRKLYMSYYPEPDINIGDKIKVILNFPNYTTKKELNDTAVVDRSNLAAKRDFVALKPEVDKLDINMNRLMFQLT